jgi:hypothetical protein
MTAVYTPKNPMASEAPLGPDDMTLLINTVKKSIYILKYGSLALDKSHIGERARQNSMYPDIPSNPFVVGEDDHEYVDEAIVSPLSPPRRKSAWHPDTWSPDRFSRGAEYDSEAHGHSHSPYTTEDVEDPSKSVHFNRVKWENQQQDEHHPRSTISSAEEFQLPRSRDVDDGLGIHITDVASGEVKSPNYIPSQRTDVRSSITKSHLGSPLNPRHLHTDRTHATASKM